MVTLDDRTIDRLERVRVHPAATQGPCAALAWALALYLIEAYHPALGLDFTPAGEAEPGRADWFGIRVAAPAGAHGLIRFWDAAIADERPDGQGWRDLGGEFLRGERPAAETLATLRDHLGLSDRGTLTPPARPPRWIFYLTLLRAAVDLLIEQPAWGLTRGLAWAERLPADQREPHPLRRPRVLGVGGSGAGEWIGLLAPVGGVYIHRRDARLIEAPPGRLTPAAGWLPDAGGRLGEYWAWRVQGATPAGEVAP